MVTAAIKENALALGFDLVGVAPAGRARHADAFGSWVEAGFAAEMGYMARDVARRQDTAIWSPGAKSVVVVGLSYDQGELPGDLWDDPSRGRIARYAWDGDYHAVMTASLERLAEFIAQKCGSEAHPRVAVDTAPVLERDAASAAGLGFVGRNTCLIHPMLGSFMFLGEIAVGVELEYDRPAGENGAELVWTAEASNCSAAARAREGVTTAAGCGHCRRCLAACPTGALAAPYQLDARRCIAYLTIEHKGSIPESLRARMGNWVFGCDACQTVCPWPRRYSRSRGGTEYRGREDRIGPSLIDLMGLTEAAFETRFRNTPLWRTKRQRLLRNVAVAMGNWGDPAAVPALERALREESPLVREHADWALARIRQGPN